MPAGEQQPNPPPEHEAAPFSPGDKTQPSRCVRTGAELAKLGNGAPDHLLSAPPGCRWNVGRRKVQLASVVGIIIITIVMLVLIIVLAAKRGNWHEPCSPLSHFSMCPSDTISFQGKCYWFSDTKGDWNSSREHCNDRGASLAIIDTEEEMEFMLRYQGLRDHWIGLHRAGGDKSWMWVDGSAFTEWFKPQGEGCCTYLNGMGISSALCHAEKHWVCSRADGCTLQRKGTHPH